MGEQAAAVPHVLLVSFPAQGHLNPLLRLAKRIAAKGPFVTFSCTHSIGRKIVASNSTSPADDTPISIGDGHLRFEFFDDGWDVDDPRRKDTDAYLPQLSTAGSAALAGMIRRCAERGRPVSCVVNNPFLPWVLDVAQELGIPSAVLWVQSCAVFSMYYHYFHSPAHFPSADNPDAAVTLPGLPTLTPDDLPTFLLPTSPYKCIANAILAQFENIRKATWVLANTFQELEPEAIEAVSAVLPSIIPIGPLIDHLESDEIRGDLWKAAEHCMEWLDSQEPRSVVYASTGSVVTLTGSEMVEMAYGLLNCGRPFLWVVREDSRNLLPEGFIDEIVKIGRGMVVSWSPQERVLAHKSVACFLTHCGWNSTLEALAAGLPVVAYPHWGDQMPDAKYIAEVYGVGVRLQAPAKRDGLVKCVDELMEGEKAEKIMKRAAEWKDAARKAVAEGGPSERNIQEFVDEIKRKARGENKLD